MDGMLLSFVLFVVAMTVTPGPGNMTMLVIGQTTGFRSAIPFLIGTTAGFASLNSLVACGLGEAFKTLPELAQVLRVAGTIYILYLAVKILRMQAAPAGAPRRFTLFEGMLIHPLSPKSWAMSVAAFSQFMPLTQYGGAVDNALFVLIFLLFQSSCHSLWCVTGAGIYNLLQNNRARIAVNISLVVLMLGATFYAFLV